MTYRRAFAFTGLALAAAMVYGQPANAEATRFEIEAQGLASALRDFARQADFQVIYEQELVADLASQGVSGHYKPTRALEILLHDTSLVYEVTETNTVTVMAPAMDPANTDPNDAEGDQESAPSATNETSESDESQEEPESEQDDGAETTNTASTETTQSVDEASESFVDRILVTASKRGETDAQELASTISAFSPEKLDRLDALEFEDVIVQVPGTNFIDNGGPGRGQEIASIRGLSPVADNTVSIVGQYLDGAPHFGRNYRLFDIGEVSVLRGPQGTLWGSQAMGGLISYRSNRPDVSAASWSFKTDLMDTSGSSGIGHRVSGHLNIPLAKDKFAIRIAAHRVDESGYIDNVATGATGVNDVEETAWRLSALAKPSENVTLTAIYHGNDLTADAPTFFDLDLGEFQIDVPFSELPATQEFDLFNFIIDVDLSWANLSYTASLFDNDNVYQDAQRGFFGFIPVARSDTILRQESTTHELRLASKNSGRFNWVAGLYLDDLEQIDLSESREVEDPFNPGTTVIGDGALLFFLGGPQTFEEQAIFGELTIELAPDWELLLGGRYFDWEVDNDQDTVFLGTSFGQEVGTVGDSDSFFKGQITHHLSDDRFLYFTRSEGFRIGGFNPFVGPNFNSSLDFLEFKPDRLINYELGFKSAWANNRLLLNTAVYQMDWEDVQTVVRDSIGVFAFTANASDLEAEGFEVELATQDLLAKGVYANANFTYNTNEFTRDAEVFPGVGRLLVEAGDSLRRTPKNTWSMDVGYDFLISDRIAGYVRGNYWHKDATTTEGFNGGDGAVPIPAQNVVNASTGVYMGDWEFKLVIDNLTDAMPLLQVFSAAPAGLPGGMTASRASSIRPRTISLQLKYTP